MLGFVWAVICADACRFCIIQSTVLMNQKLTSTLLGWLRVREYWSQTLGTEHVDGGASLLVAAIGYTH